MNKKRAKKCDSLFLNFIFCLFAVDFHHLMLYFKLLNISLFKLNGCSRIVSSSTHRSEISLHSLHKHSKSKSESCTPAWNWRGAALPEFMSRRAGLHFHWLWQHLPAGPLIENRCSAHTGGANAAKPSRGRWCVCGVMWTAGCWAVTIAKKRGEMDFLPEKATGSSLYFYPLIC